MTMHTRRDFQYALRTLARNPGFAATAVLTLALGIGANTAIFSVVRTALLKPLPYPDPDRLVLVQESNPFIGEPKSGLSGPDYLDLRDHNQVLEDLAVIEPGTGTLTGLGEPMQFPGMRVSVNFFSMIGAKTVLGRTFRPEDGRGGRQNVVVMTYGFWQRYAGGDPKIIGRQFKVDGLLYTAIGVLSPDFYCPIPSEAFVPWPEEELRSRNRLSHNLGGIGRLKPGVTIEQARADLNRVFAGIIERYPAVKGFSVIVQPMQEALVEYIRPALLALFGAVGLVLLIACSNVANLLVARAAARQREVAVRTALGAGRGRLARQFLTESVVLSIIGGSIGLLFALWGLELLKAVLPGTFPVPETTVEAALQQIEFDGWVFAFNLALSFASGLLFGLAPALHASRGDVAEPLKQSSRGTQGPGQHRLRDALVMAEVALAMVLLAGAGLMIESFRRLKSVDPGFRPQGILAAEIELPTDSKYRTGAEQRAFYRQVIAKLESIPGVKSVGLTSLLPLSPQIETRYFAIEGRAPLANGLQLGAAVNVVNPRYQETMGIPLLRGRLLSESDSIDRPPVVLIDETLARLHFPGEDPLGRRLRVGSRLFEVAGITGSVKSGGLDKDFKPTIYFSYLQASDERMTFLLRVEGDPTSYVNTLKRAVWAVDAEMPVYNVRTMDDVVARTLSAARLTLLLLGLFAGVAVLMASLGVYGVLTYAVNQRTQEIGIRMAMGASSGDVLRQVARQGMTLVLAGSAAGTLAALVLTRVLSALLFGVSAADPKVYAGVFLLLSAAAVIAVLLPARRASRLDPIIALRYE